MWVILWEQSAGRFCLQVIAVTPHDITESWVSGGQTVHRPGVGPPPGRAGEDVEILGELKRFSKLSVLGTVSLAAVLVLGSVAQAGLMFYEPFNYTGGTNVEGNGAPRLGGERKGAEPC